MRSQIAAIERQSTRISGSLDDLLSTPNSLWRQTPVPITSISGLRQRSDVNLAEIWDQVDGFEVWNEVLQASSFVEDLRLAKDYTVFVAHDSAFGKMRQVDVDAVLSISNVADIDNFVKRHTLTKAFRSELESRGIPMAADL